MLKIISLSWKFRQSSVQIKRKSTVYSLWPIFTLLDRLLAIMETILTLPLSPYTVVYISIYYSLSSGADQLKSILPAHINVPVTIYVNPDKSIWYLTRISAIYESQHAL